MGSINSHWQPVAAAQKKTRMKACLSDQSPATCFCITTFALRCGQRLAEKLNLFLLYRPPFSPLCFCITTLITKDQNVSP